ncbi:MAG: hypothetical protein ACRDOU_14285 [Streptosporangiaceae bacterium]
MSKKTGQRRSGAARKAPATASAAGARGTSATSTARGDAPAGTSRQAGPSRWASAARDEEAAVVERLFGRLLTAVAAGDPLSAELETATFMAIPHAMGQATPEQVEAFIAKVLVDGAVTMRTPEGAALLRLLALLGSPATKRAASQGLGKLTQAGVYPPDWVTEAGKPVPGRAWRRYDVFGDHEVVAVTFSYGEAEHAIVAQVDLTGLPTAVMVGVTPNPADVIEGVTRDDDPFVRVETIGLAEARWRLEEPLDRCEADPIPGSAPDTTVFLPVMRSRVRRLPAGDGWPAPSFTADDRKAAVDEFLSNPLAAEAVAADEAATRFWAEVLTGYSSHVPGEPPGQVGPRKLTHILLGNVPSMFTLTPAQRQHLEPAVTAWTHWSAARRNLDDNATAMLTDRLPVVFGRFDQAYDADDAALARTYMADLATSDVDFSWLADRVGRRMFALPMPEAGEASEFRDASDPQVRRDMTEAEFADCNPPGGMAREQFMTAVHRVISELWDDDPPETFAAAKLLFSSDHNRHDVIHALAERAASSADR